MSRRSSRGPGRAGSSRTWRPTPQDPDGAEQTAALMIAAPEVIVTRAVLASAAAESARTDGSTGDLLLLAVAYDFAPDCDDRYGRVRVVKIRPHRDLQIGDLKPEAAHQAFVMVGQPEIAVHEESPDPATGVPRISVEVLGYDTYNPATGTVEASAGAAKISCFMVDIDHDSMNFYRAAYALPGRGWRPADQGAQANAGALARRCGMGRGTLEPLRAVRAPCGWGHRGEDHHRGRRRDDGRAGCRAQRLTGRLATALPQNVRGLNGDRGAAANAMHAPVHHDGVT